MIRYFHAPNVGIIKMEFDKADIVSDLEIDGIKFFPLEEANEIQRKHEAEAPTIQVRVKLYEVKPGIIRLIT